MGPLDLDCQPREETQWACLAKRKNREAKKRLTHLHNQHVLMGACWGERRGRKANNFSRLEMDNKLLI